MIEIDETLETRPYGRSAASISPSVRDQLEQHQLLESAFPQLRSVIYGNSFEGDEVPRYPVFLAFGPSVQKVHLVQVATEERSCLLRNPGLQLYKTVEEVASRSIERLILAPSLTDLAVRAGCYKYRHLRTDLDYLSLPLATATTALGSLIHLSIPEIPLLPSALLHLASIRSLNFAEIYIQSKNYEWKCMPADTQCSTSFAALECLRIRSDSFDWFVGLLHAFEFPALKRFVVESEDIVYGPVFECFTQALSASSFALQHMETVDLRLGCLLNVPLNEAAPVYLGAAEFAPLFALSALQSLSIRGHCHVILDDAALDAASRAWPGLTKLYLEPARRSKDALIYNRHKPAWPPATFAGLLCLAERCHHLHTLGLALDLVALPSTSELRRALDRLASQESPCPLRSLAVGW